MNSVLTSRSMASESDTPPPLALYDNSKPREERDFRELYPDLDESTPLRVFVQNDTPVEEETPNFVPSVNRPTFKRIKVDRANDTRFPKLLAEYGFVGSHTHSTTSATYIRPFSEPKASQRRPQVEYDMDEQDSLYLEDRNSKNAIKISAEVFEILMTRLESEWALLERRMNMSVPPNDDDDTQNLSLILNSNNDKYGNDDGIVPGSIYDQKCAVCNDSDCDNSNAIVFCDGCDIAVHQECYGIAFIPEGQWYCRRCMINKSETSCVFCPSTTGAFKQLDNSLWSHVVCAMWINELYFANPVYMEPIEGMDLIPRSRWKLLCYICKQRMGACIQCSNRGCFQAYHVTCAKRAGLYMEFTQGVATAITNKLTLKTFCDRHLPKHMPVGPVHDGILKTRLFFRDTKLLVAENAKLSKSKRTANKLNIFKWKTENHQTPLAPKMFSDILFNVLVQLKVEQQINLPGQVNSQVRELSLVPNRPREIVNKELHEIADEMCRLWCLKKESRRGATLIRRSGNNGLGTGTGNATADRLEFAKVLQEDLARLINLNEIMLERQITLKDEFDSSFAAVNAVYFSVSQSIRNTIEELNRKFDTHRILQHYKSKVVEEQEVSSLAEIIEKNDTYQYHTIEQLVADLEQFHANILKVSKSSNNIVRVSNRWMSQFHRVLPDLYRFEEKVKRGEVFGDFNVKGASISFVRSEHSRRELLEEFDLSEVELDENGRSMEFDTVEDADLFERFLGDGGGTSGVLVGKAGETSPGS